MSQTIFRSAAIAVLMLALVSSTAFAGKKPKKDTGGGSQSCEWVPAKSLADNVSQGQADIIMEEHCSGTTPANIAMMFMSANPPLTEQDVENQICLLDTSASFCP